MTRSTVLKKFYNFYFYVIGEPLGWIICCFYRPGGEEKFDDKVIKGRKRLVLLLRSFLPLFLITYPAVILLKLILIFFLFPTIGSDYFTTKTNFVPDPAGNYMLGATGETFSKVTIINFEPLKFLVDATIYTLLGLVLGLMLGLVMGLMLGLMFGLVFGLVFGLDLGQVFGLVMGIVFGLVFGLLFSKVSGLRWRLVFGLMSGLVLGLDLGLVFGLVNGLGYIAAYYCLGYFRLFLYPADCFSVLRIFFKVRHKPSMILTQLQTSALHWNEVIFLPLPTLKTLLYKAVAYDLEATRQELEFIIFKRPQQATVAWQVLIKLILNELEQRETLREIAGAGQVFEIYLSQDLILRGEKWVTPLRFFSASYQDAMRYSSPLGRKARQEALADMIANLRKVTIGGTNPLPVPELNRQLIRVAQKWLEIARATLDKLESESPQLGQLDNPYSPGLSLQSKDSLFVGRRDLVRQLGEALGKGSRRPTFLLTGERRMGKTSTLRQLSYLLGARYVPVFYDLQTTGILASTASFLASIAEGVFEALILKGIKIKRLDFVRLEKTQQESQAAVYREFGNWLKGVEKILAKKEKTLLLTFDEFETLAEAADETRLHLGLLLDWFRSTIQNFPRTAFLFSGVRSFSEMGQEWPGHFVNVQTLKLGFLRPQEARELVVHPTNEFRGEEIFAEAAVVEEIIRQTGGHPFLVQAVCSYIIEELNLTGRIAASYQDVEQAIEQTLEDWWDAYFIDLWQRTGSQERQCLKVLVELEQAHATTLQQKTGLEGRSFHKTIQTLRKRDLIVSVNTNNLDEPGGIKEGPQQDGEETSTTDSTAFQSEAGKIEGNAVIQPPKERFAIAAPIFCEWVKRNIEEEVGS